MHDDETRHARDDDARWEPHDPDGGQGHYGQGQFGAHDGWAAANGARPAGASTTQATQANPRRGVGFWLVPLLLLLAGLAAFAIVMFFLSGKDSSGGAPTVAQSQGGAASQPAATASSSTPPADFPPDASTQCVQDGNDVDNPLQDEIRMQDGAGTSCGYLVNVRRQVLDHLQSDRSGGQFTITPESPVNDNAIYPATCQNAGSHLTYCWTENRARMWIKDSIN